MIKLIRESSQPLEPLPVHLTAEWEALIPKKGVQVLKGIRSVLFDIYGTLFISGAGEISAGITTEKKSFHISLAKDSANAEFSETQRNTENINIKDPLCAFASLREEFEDQCSEMTEYFRSAVKQQHEKAHAEGIVWPEVRVEEIWADYKGAIPPGWELTQGMRGQEMALRYELAVNPVFPMPHAKETLRTLAVNGVKLGIISNAQFYTPLLFNAFFNASPTELGFDPELLIYSFEENEAKPSPRLFAKARERLAQYTIKPEETLYIGNDMKNDISAAAEEGFITALFAGDRRSLRLREGDPACAGKKPHFVVNDLQALCT